MMLNKKQAVIFDLDGTLVDSMWIWKDIDIEYLGRFGHTLPQNLQKTIEGMSYTETAAYFKDTFQIPDSIEEIKQAWYEMAYQKYAHEVSLKPGVIDFLDALKRQGTPLGIATSNGKELAAAVIAAHRLEEYFSVIATACEVARGKPSPDIYLHVAAKLKSDPAGCLVFEDVPMGILAGKNAGMEVCAVEDPCSAHQQEEKKKLADYYIKDYDDIFRQTYEVLHHEK